jgi:hypothetical protein
VKFVNGEVLGKCRRNKKDEAQVENKKSNYK